MTDEFRAMCAELVDDLEMSDWPSKLKEAFRADIARARTLLDQPVAEEPTDEELNALWIEQYGDTGHEPAMSIFGFKSGARAVLAKWGHPTPQPVAVGERLPGPEDCLDEGWAWFFNQRIGWRQAVLPISPGYTHWLPANVLPIPEAQ